MNNINNSWLDWCSCGDLSWCDLFCSGYIYTTVAKNLPTNIFHSNSTVMPPVYTGNGLVSTFIHRFRPGFQAELFSSHPYLRDTCEKFLDFICRENCDQLFNNWQIIQIVKNWNSRFFQMLIVENICSKARKLYSRNF